MSKITISNSRDILGTLDIDDAFDKFMDLNMQFSKYMIQITDHDKFEDLQCIALLKDISKVQSFRNSCVTRFWVFSCVLLITAVWFLHDGVLIHYSFLTVLPSFLISEYEWLVLVDIFLLGVECYCSLCLLAYLTHHSTTLGWQRRDLGSLWLVSGKGVREPWEKGEGVEG